MSRGVLATHLCHFGDALLPGRRRRHLAAAVRRPRPATPDLTQPRPCVVAAATATRPPAAAVRPSDPSVGPSDPSVGPSVRSVSPAGSSAPSVPPVRSLGRSAAAPPALGTGQVSARRRGGRPLAARVRPREGAWPAHLRGSLTPGVREAAPGVSTDSAGVHSRCPAPVSSYSALCPVLVPSPCPAPVSSPCPAPAPPRGTAPGPVRPSPVPAHQKRPSGAARYSSQRSRLGTDALGAFRAANTKKAPWNPACA